MVSRLWRLGVQNRDGVRVGSSWRPWGRSHPSLLPAGNPWPADPALRPLHLSSHQLLSVSPCPFLSLIGTPSLDLSSTLIRRVLILIFNLFLLQRFCFGIGHILGFWADMNFCPTTPPGTEATSQACRFSISGLGPGGRHCFEAPQVRRMCVHR